MLPIIPATVIGSWSFPGWYHKFCEDVAQHPEAYGAYDREEAVRDAIRLAIQDQVNAGADIISDGEMQRVDFNLGFYDYLEGLKRLPPRPPLGSSGSRSTLTVSRRRAAARAQWPGSRRGIHPATHADAAPRKGARAWPVHARRLPARGTGL